MQNLKEEFLSFRQASVKFNKMIEKIRAFIDKYGGKCIVLDGQVLLIQKSKYDFKRLS